MTKEITAILFLTLIAISSLVGWAIFERASILAQIDFSQKEAGSLDPTLNLQVLEEVTEPGD